MKKTNLGYFFNKLIPRNKHYPFTGHIELTYRCNLKCIHCYCKGSENKEKELKTFEWKQIFDELHKEGCIYLTLSGGDPFVRDDFLELYSYIKKKAFLVNIFTNATAVTSQVFDYLAKSPPHTIEVTLNGITRSTYEQITQVEGSFARVKQNLREIKKRNLPLTLKSNCLKQNKAEVAKIKGFTDEFLGKKNHRYHFQYDTMIYPRINGDREPLKFRLSFRELSELRREDPDIWEEYQQHLHASAGLERRRDSLYNCNTWLTNFFINPYGRLKFCQFSDKFSVDLKGTSFKEGFYKVFPQTLKEKFKTNSKCRDCRLRPVCHNCPARAYLETGDEEAPVPYFCTLAKETAGEIAKFRNQNNYPA